MKREKVQRHRGPSTPREVSSLGSTIHEELEADSRCPKATPGLPPHKLSSGPGWSRHGTQTTPALGLPGPCGVQATEQARTLAPSSLPPRPGMSSAPTTVLSALSESGSLWPAAQRGWPASPLRLYGNLPPVPSLTAHRQIKHLPQITGYEVEKVGFRPVVPQSCAASGVGPSLRTYLAP